MPRSAGSTISASAEKHGLRAHAAPRDGCGQLIDADAVARQGTRHLQNDAGMVKSCQLKPGVLSAGVDAGPGLVNRDVDPILRQAGEVLLKLGSVLRRYLDPDNAGKFATQARHGAVDPVARIGSDCLGQLFDDAGPVPGYGGQYNIGLLVAIFGFSRHLVTPFNAVLVGGF